MKFRYLLAVLTVFAVSAVTAAGVEKYIPADTAIFAELKVKPVVDHKEVVDFLNTEDGRKAIAMWTGITGLSLQEDMEEVLFFADKDARGGLLFRIKNSEKLTARLDSPGFADEVKKLAGTFGGEIKFSRVVKAGRVLYCFEEDKDDRLVLTLLEAGLVLVAQDDDIDKILRAPKITVAAMDGIRSYLPDNRYFLRAVWVNREFGSSGKNDDAEILKDFKAASAGFRVGSGKDYLDQYYVLKLICAGPEQAAMQSMMIPGYLQIGAGMAFSKQPQMAEKLLKGFRTAVKDNTVIFDLHVPGELYAELRKMAGEMAKDKFIAPGAVPSDTKSGKK